MAPPIKRHIVEQPDDLTIRLIPLTGGHNAIVDAEIYDYLIQWNWYAHKGRRTFYAKRHSRIDDAPDCPRIIPMHSVVHGGLKPDHINGNGLDNRKANLRDALAFQNAQNAPSKRARMKGAFLLAGRYWFSSIMANRTKIWLGYFPSELAAHEAYCDAAKKYHGEFARLA